MDLSKFSAELEKVGLVAKNDESNHFKDINSVTLPFYMDTSLISYEINRDLIKDVNFIYNSKRPLTVDEFEAYKDKIFNDDGKKIYNWVLQHMHSVQVVTKGNIRKKDDKFSAAKDFEDRLEYDTRYGLYSLCLYIKYDKQSMTLKLEINNARRLENAAAFNGYHIQDIYDKSKTCELLNLFSEVSEFVPIYLDEESTGVHFNFSYDKKDRWVSSYGENILHSKYALDRLRNDEFFTDELCINPRAWYFFVSGRDGKCYLKRDQDKSPKTYHSKGEK